VKHRLRVCENRVLRRIFGLSRDEMTGGWRKLHNEELRMAKSRRMRWAGHVTATGANKNTYRILVRKPEGKRPIGRPRCS
jgi:hypothetical protein